MALCQSGVTLVLPSSKMSSVRHLLGDCVSLDGVRPPDVPKVPALSSSGDPAVCGGLRAQVLRLRTRPTLGSAMQAPAIRLPGRERGETIRTTPPLPIAADPGCAVPQAPKDLDTDAFVLWTSLSLCLRRTMGQTQLPLAVTYRLCSWSSRWLQLGQLFRYRVLYFRADGLTQTANHYVLTLTRSISFIFFFFTSTGNSKQFQNSLPEGYHPATEPPFCTSPQNPPG